MDLEQFERFWSLYPKRTPWPNPKRAAELAFARALKRGSDVEQLCAGAKAYATFCRAKKVDPKFICMAATFLNQDRYEDFVADAPAKDLAKEILLGE